MRSFRKATLSDLPAIYAIVKESQQLLKERGVDQWQDDPPSPAKLENDIAHSQLYVLEDGEILGMCACVNVDDPNYLNIEGQWLGNGPYSNIHRFAVSRKHSGQGLGKLMLQECVKISPFDSVRIDTHHDNLAMRKVIAQVGFQYCGIIKLESGAKRDAFELIKEKTT